MSIATAARTLSTAASVLMGYLYVGGHVQNDTLVASYSEGIFGTRAIGVDARAGMACVGDACHEECLWWTSAIGNETDVSCEEWIIRHLLGLERLERALVRAGRCAQRAVETCVLSHEVGLELPAAFVWNGTEGRMRLFLMPRTSVRSNARTRRVALLAPGSRASDAPTHETMLDFATEVLVEHYDAWSHEMRTEVLTEDAAYCLQLLRLSVPTECADAMPLQRPLRGFDDRV